MKTKNSRTLKAVVAACGLFGAASANAGEVEVTITNLTSAQYFTPVIAIGHNRSLDLFTAGDYASAAVQAIAEGGDVSLAKAAADSVSAPSAVAGGLTAPGESVTLTFTTGKGQRYLSIASMLLPTNDGFVGLDSVRIPRLNRSRSYMANAYDAGTEYNNEVINGGGAPGVLGIPVDPGGNAGTGGTGVSGGAPAENKMIHIHRGILGDRDPNGGESDLDSAVHGFNTPVARVTVTHRPRRATNSGK